MELADLIPEINQIEDPHLRDQVVAVWEEALERGGWTLEDLPDIPYTLLVEAVGISFPDHVRTVCRLCLSMAQVIHEAYGDRYSIDQDALIAGALLADVGKLMEFQRGPEGFEWSDHYQYLRHPFTGVALCEKHNIPPSVMHIIATHSWEGDHFQRRPEAIIFHHADFTDFDLSKYEGAVR